MKALALLLLVASPAFASSDFYDIAMDLTLSGKHIGSPQLTVRGGETGAIVERDEAGDGWFVEVTPTEGDGIKMSFTIGTIAKNGERTIVGTPRIVANDNEPAKITQGANGVEQLSLGVTVHTLTN